LLVIIILAVIVPVTIFHSDLIGWWRGEAIYQGRYTNAWRAELRKYDQVIGYFEGRGGAERWFLFYWHEPTQWERWLAKLWPARFPTGRRQFDPPWQEGDAEAIPVLLELLHQAPEPNVRALAARGLGQVGPAAHEAVPMLLAALDDEADIVAHEAAAALCAVDPQALESVGLGQGKWRYYRFGDDSIPSRD
jgi:hypothetical protein